VKDVRIFSEAVARVASDHQEALFAVDALEFVGRLPYGREVLVPERAPSIGAGNAAMRTVCLGDGRQAKEELERTPAVHVEVAFVSQCRV